MWGSPAKGEGKGKDSREKEIKESRGKKYVELFLEGKRSEK